MVCETKESSPQISPTDSCLAQLTEHETGDLEVVSSKPTGVKRHTAIWTWDGGTPCQEGSGTPTPVSWMMSPPRLPDGVPPHPPGVERQTDTGENITFSIPSECGR